MQRGIKKINYADVWKKGPKKTWTSARISVTFQDVELMLDPVFWEEHFTVVPWKWKERVAVPEHDGVKG